MLPKGPLANGDWTIRWRVGDRRLHEQRITAITVARFAQSLRVVDSRWVLSDGEQLQTVRTLPVPVTQPFGPCFLLASCEAGAAGLVQLEVYSQIIGQSQPGVTLSGEVLVSDGPSPFVPGVIDGGEAQSLAGFQLHYRSRLLGMLSVRPMPEAKFTAEGGFIPPPEFLWNPLADEELTERLARLLKPPE
jgi:hypothetical protein